MRTPVAQRQSDGSLVVCAQRRADGAVVVTADNAGDGAPCVCGGGPVGECCISIYEKPCEWASGPDEVQYGRIKGSIEPMSMVVTANWSYNEYLTQNGSVTYVASRFFASSTIRGPLPTASPDDPAVFEFTRQITEFCRNLSGDRFWSESGTITLGTMKDLCGKIDPMGSIPRPTPCAPQSGLNFSVGQVCSAMIVANPDLTDPPYDGPFAGTASFNFGNDGSYSGQCNIVNPGNLPSDRDTHIEASFQVSVKHGSGIVCQIPDPDPAYRVVTECGGGEQDTIFSGAAVPGEVVRLLDSENVTKCFEVTDLLSDTEPSRLLTGVFGDCPSCNGTDKPLLLAIPCVGFGAPVVVIPSAIVGPGRVVRLDNGFPGTACYRVTATPAGTSDGALLHPVLAYGSCQSCQGTDPPITDPIDPTRPDPDRPGLGFQGNAPPPVDPRAAAMTHEAAFGCKGCGG